LFCRGVPTHGHSKPQARLRVTLNLRSAKKQLSLLASAAMEAQGTLLCLHAYDVGMLFVL